MKAPHVGPDTAVLSSCAGGLRADEGVWGRPPELREQEPQQPRWKTAASTPRERTRDRLGEKKDSREIRSKDFLSSALGFTWQVRRFNLAGCLLDWSKEKKKRRYQQHLSPEASGSWDGEGGGQVDSGNNLKSLI